MSELRRLAAIMFTDMVGYTALGQKNESLSLALAEEQRKLIRPVLAKHRGREVKTMGDAFLVEFSSALDAVRCAYDIQRTTREFNFSMPEDRRVHLRVGIHLGDVVESAGDISGDAVNIASRLQPLADDGGVCLSQQVYDHVQNKFDLPLSSIGSKALKNVTVPLMVYKIVMPWEREVDDRAPTLNTSRIAVLPFANMSPDPDDWYFADGITEEIISTLSGVKGLSVISRTSVMGYKGTTKKLREIGLELEAGSVLEGSFRKAGNKIRITTQLINTTDDKHLWAQRYDRELDDVFRVQTDIATQVADALRIRILPDEKERIERALTKSTEAFSLYLKGRYYWNERTEEGTKMAMQCFDEAARLDPALAMAYTGISDCYNILSDYGWMAPSKARPLARANALKALELDESLAEAHASLALSSEDLTSGERELKSAIGLKPNYAPAHHWYALMLSSLRRYEEAYEKERRALELDPHSRVYQMGVARGLTYLGKFEEGIRQYERVIEEHPEFAAARGEFAAALAYQSRFERAIEEGRKAAEMDRGSSGWLLNLAWIYAVAGQTEDAEKTVEKVLSAGDRIFFSSTLVAMAKLAMGQKQDGYRWLERAYAEHDPYLFYFSGFPWCNEYRSDPRWTEIARKLGLPTDT
ncbi:MAG: tetratricopeptide repeat protein [archaeon]|nr:MAG: tetratricopeptide repeat protein [archaeon]